MDALSMAYSQAVEYSKRLEELLLTSSLIDEEGIASIRSKYITPITNVDKEWLEGSAKEEPIDELRRNIQNILIKKCSELRTLDSASIAVPILECEIHDAEYIITFIDSNQEYTHKLSALETIVKQTTSNSIYEVVNAFLRR